MNMMNSLKYFFAATFRLNHAVQSLHAELKKVIQSKFSSLKYISTTQNQLVLPYKFVPSPDLPLDHLNTL